MRYLWLLPLLLLSGCYYPYGPYYGYGGYTYPTYPSYGYPQSYPGSSPPPPYSNQQPYPGAQQPYTQQPYYGSAQPGYGSPAANDPNNCGTPDEPKPCYRTYR